MAHSPSPPPPPPPLYPYWFYTSSLVIDDPLSPLPIATTTTAAKQPPRPFSRYDCTNLEAAYQELLDDLRSQPPETASESRNASQPAPLAAVKRTKSREVALEGHPLWNSDSDDDELQLRNEIPGTTPTADSGDSQAERWPSTGLSGSPTERRPSSGLSGSPLRKFMVPPSSSAPAYSTESTAAANTTKNPFIRSLSLSRATSSQPSSRRSSFTSGRKPPPSESPAPPPQQKEIPVGIQRLHKVLLPSLVMAPLYWSPLHDVSSVVRGTWFYKDSMLPVETEMANRLETGWEEVRAWTEEWEMELSSAVEVGREGEGKVRWQLWDTKPSTSAPSSRPGTAVELGAEQILPTSTANSAPSRAKPNEWDWVIFANSRDAYICRDTMLSFGQRRPLANIRRGRTVGIHVVRGFSESEWLKLHPQPNSKRPASTPARSRAASVAPTQSPIPTYIKEKNRRSYSTGSEFQAGGDVGGFEQHQEEGLGLGLGEDDEMRGKVTDLFLVIHGIGQKLSERVESFHFTHAINSFRRLLNVELHSEAVRPHLRDDVGVMVLPVNWRHNLTFEDGIDGTAASGSPDNMFTLDDITPPTIPAVRNLVSDIILDIPYYLSHHKEKMVKAVVAEANRIYRLWCKNNPGFEKDGRVHIIAHSLGTAIAMDILSKQPTRVTVYDPTPLTRTVYDSMPPPQSSGSGWGKRRSREIPLPPVDADDRFLFDTSNIFFCGSPAGFFLLLNRSVLLPRKGRNKPGSFGEDKDPGVAGEAGKYGCLAVDNIYNVLHYSDPIAYTLNPTVDTSYATTLKTAYVPSTTTTFLDTLSGVFRSVIPGGAEPPSFARLPSNIELETHDFTREELAEKRLFLLNDNGQLDWYLRGSGTLENQYLNVLGAHSSYWESRDFARMLVVEVGRGVGRAGTVRAMRAVKRRGLVGK